MSTYFKGKWIFSILLICFVTGVFLSKISSTETVSYPSTEKIPTITNYHGVEVTDDYQWLENGTDAQVVSWSEAQDGLTRRHLSRLPELAAIETRLSALMHYDTESFQDALEGSCRFIWSKTAQQEKTVLSIQDSLSAAKRTLLDPHLWGPHASLEFAVPSREGAYVAFAKSMAGDECPLIQILQTSDGKVLPDTLKGFKQGWPTSSVAWLPENKGFFYSAHPSKGTVPPGEEFYWNSLYFHRLGTQAEDDLLVFSDPLSKETFHTAYLSEDGQTIFFMRTRTKSHAEVYFLRTEAFLQNPLTPPKRLTPPLENAFSVIAVENRFYIFTDLDAPRGRIFVTEQEHPEVEHWKEWLSESNDRLLGIQPGAGQFYAIYLHHAHTLIKVFDREGRFVEEIPLPTLGSASVSSHWSKPDVWVDFSSFSTPTVRYRWDPVKHQLTEFIGSKASVRSQDFKVEQVWYSSKDGTPISMFLIYASSNQKKGETPVLLTGYGGFDVSMQPLYSPFFLTFIEASGGMVAMPNLRGGGEYGKAWHEAGKQENKQNVFDDFIAAAEWLIEQGYTSPPKLGIFGGSNGGLLTGAALTQRPDLFGSVVSDVPLLDMLRYHHFGFANIWAEEYGSSENREQWAYLFRYSPYHRIEDGRHYPPSLIIAAENDSRVDPCHAKKMVAKLQAADPKGGPHYLLIMKDAGHRGASEITTRAQQRAKVLAFHLYHTRS